MDQFTIEFIDIAEANDLADRFWCKGQSGHVPFMVANEERQDDGNLPEVNEFMLVGGLLYTWSDEPSDNPLMAETARLEQLTKLREGFGFVDIEGLIIGYAHRMRLLYGNRVSSRLLRNGRALFPSSSPIAADLSMDLGYILSESDMPECRPIVQELLDTIGSIDENETEAEIWQHVLMMKLAALKLTGTEKEIADHLENAIKGKITSPDLQIAVNRLANMISGDAREAFQSKEWTGLSVQTMEEHECDH